MDYLEEQRDVVLDALRHGGDLIARKGESWRTTLWTRTAADAESLRAMLRGPIHARAAELDAAAVATIDLVEEAEEDGSRWGVRVELRFPER